MDSSELYTCRISRHIVYKPDGSLFCLNLSDYQGGNAPHINNLSGEYSRDDFEIDYNKFLATSNLKIKYWVKFKGYLSTYDIPLEDYKIIYDKKPSFTISNIVVTDRGPYSDGTSRDSYMSYTVDYTVDGGLFVSEIYEKYGENWETSGVEYVIFDEFDDKTTFTSKGKICYASKNTKASPISFFAILRNGNKYQFNQGMIFQGGALSVSNNTRSVSSKYEETGLFSNPLIVVNE